MPGELHRRSQVDLLRSHAGGSGDDLPRDVSAALLAELRALAHPVKVDSVPSSDDQEDHVSMGMTGALMALDAADRLERILAGELLCAAQALHCDAAYGPPGKLVVAGHAAVRARVAPPAEDRPPAPDVAALRPLVADGTLAALLGGAAAGPNRVGPTPTPAGASPR